ncbi:MAG: hypothetical protein MJA28_07450 [Gammaproteobacteria bacterium]|nr:hypothetical protein [Gammaproteobacteria bacterium]
MPEPDSPIRPTTSSGSTYISTFFSASTKIYLMFSLGQRDILPADDLALQMALMKLKLLEDRPTPKQAME